MASVKVLSTTRIGQLTGSTDLDEDQPKWPLLVDAEQWPLLNDTGRWDAIGVDLGANTEHKGRTYIFFGDVATKPQSGIPINADLVAWIDESDVLRHGGHLALGWKFVIPFEPTGVRGQPDWRFCGKCGSLFWNGYDTKGVCPKDGTGHEAIGFNFVLPYNPGEDQLTEGGWHGIASNAIARRGRARSRNSRGSRPGSCRTRNTRACPKRRMNKGSSCLGFSIPAILASVWPGCR